MAERAEERLVNNSSRRRPLKLSMKAFCCGLPGAMCDDSGSLGMAYRSFREVLAGLTPASIRRLQSNLVTQIPA